MLTLAENRALKINISGGGVDCSLPPTAMCLNAGAMGRQDAESETLIPTTGGGFDVAGTMKSMDKSGGWSNSADHAAAGYMIPVRDCAPALTSNYGKQPDSSDTSAGPMLIAHAYDTRNGMAPHGSMQGDIISQTLRAKEAEPPLVTYPINTQIAMRHEALGEGTSMKQQTYLRQSMAVRRLTPTECERLQGFLDGHTAITFRGKPAADGPRYKALGNSMACNVMAWIGSRIEMVQTS